MEQELISLFKTLIAKPSISPDDAGCQDVLIERLTRCGFRITKLPAGKVSNFWAEHGSGSPCLAFAGHTDVVPIGDSNAWDTAPFEPTIKNNILYGRGAADMKSGLSAMVLACEQMVKEHPNHPGRLGLLITSGEDGDHYQDGTPVVMEHLNKHQLPIDYCVIGEPSSHQTVGDVVRIGRRGSLNVTMKIIGKQGHVAYPEQVLNPIHLSAAIIKAINDTKWDNGNAYFPPTSHQVTAFQPSPGASNLVPEYVELQLNFRYSSELTAATIQTRLNELVHAIHSNVIIDYNLSGEPFLTQPGKLIQAVSDSIETIVGITPELSTSGGTSDGRFIAPYGVEVVELGPVNATIHKANENIQLTDLEQLFRLYRQIIKNILLAES